MPLTHRSVVMLHAHGGLVNYRYDTEDPAIKETDHSRFSYFGLKAEIARNTLDVPLYPRRGSDLHLSAIFISGRDKYEPYNFEKFISRTTRQWVGARFRWDKYFHMPNCSWFSLGIMSMV